MAMPTATREAVTALLSETSPGGRRAFDEIFPLVYQELRQLARRQLAGARRHTLDTTGLVHEAYLKLVDDTKVPLKNQAYFFGAAARAMRQVLVDAARRRVRLKRGGGDVDTTLDEATLAVEEFAVEVVELNDSLEHMAKRFPRQAEIVECRFFGGLTLEETAAALDLSERTVVRDWAMARTWLCRELNNADR